jgi:hypothetical protein
LGRWTWITLQGSNNESITIYNVYNVCKNTIGRAGPATAFAQQWHLLRLSGNTSPDPRKQCITDFNSLLKEHQKQQGQTIIVGDLNEELGTDLSGFASICADYNLADIHAHFHPDTNDLVTYARGSKRVDYAMASTTLLPWINNNGFNPFNLVHFFDHRAGYFDINLQGALGPDPQPFTRAAFRHIGSSSTNIPQFINTAYAHMSESSLFKSSDDFRANLDSLDQPEDIANVLDTILTQGLLHGQKACRKPPQPPWLEKLHKASCRVQFWNTILTERSTGVCMAPATYAIGQEIWPNQIPQIPHCTNIIRKAVRAYEKQLNGIRRLAKADREKFLHELRARIALRKVKGDDQEKAISNIEKQLHNTKNFAAIKRAIKQQAFLPLNKVDIMNTKKQL